MLPIQIPKEAIDSKGYVNFGSLSVSHLSDFNQDVATAHIGQFTQVMLFKLNMAMAKIKWTGDDKKRLHACYTDKDIADALVYSAKKRSFSDFEYILNKDRPTLLMFMSNSSSRLWTGVYNKFPDLKKEAEEVYHNM